MIGMNYVIHTREVLEQVAAERDRQDAKFGQQNHHPYKWLTILQEEMGEAAREACEADCKRREGPNPENTEMVLRRRGERDEHLANLRKELIETAAVAVAIVEGLDRNKWTWGD